jgi:hypothetical protein
LLLGHVPPSENFYIPSCLNYYRQVSKTYSSLIVGHFFGHLHIDLFRPLIDEGGNPFGSIFGGGSICPCNLNPTFKIFEYKESALNINMDPFFLDFTQFNVNLNQSNFLGYLNIYENYSFKKEYQGFKLFHSSFPSFRRYMFEEHEEWKKFLTLSFQNFENYVFMIKSLQPVQPFDEGEGVGFFNTFVTQFCEGDTTIYKVGNKTVQCVDLFRLSSLKRLVFQQ